jgi:hypothetical protein
MMMMVDSSVLGMALGSAGAKNPAAHLRGRLVRFETELKIYFPRYLEGLRMRSSRSVWHVLS